ncbi:MAG: HAMP domain-containing histidine kinase, partial [Candidatus Delongbacteria bacterium]|nr:HAMP domain-containing histidine kinase [Candidatus Delongbacteria bacterium]
DLAVFIYALINVKSSDKKLALETKKLLKKHEVTKIFNNLKNLVVSNKKSIEMIDQIVNSTSKMSFYSREFSLNSINEIIKDVLVLVNNNIKYNAKVELELHAKLPKYKCNFQEIAQILFNLLSNAKDAISQKGLHSDQGIIKIGTKFENKNIILEVEDNGCGMDESQLNKAFNSFYTTKEMGKGLGLGLSIVKSIVDNYSGRISIQSKLNEGTKFRISFPTKKDISIERDNDTLNSVVFLGKSDDKTEVETEEQASTISEELSDDDVFNNSNIDLEQYTSDDEELSDDDLFNDDDIYLNDNNEARDA